MKNKRTKVVTVKFKEEIYSLMKKVAEVRGEDMSDFIRRAVRIHLAMLGYLDEEKKRLLLNPRELGRG